jgi:hypothetical protein
VCTELSKPPESPSVPQQIHQILRKQCLPIGLVVVMVILLGWHLIIGDPIEIEDTPASRRQRILELLGDGGKLRSTYIATHLGCSLKTVKRERETLRLAGKIEFIGPNKTGIYQLVAG